MFLKDIQEKKLPHAPGVYFFLGGRKRRGVKGKPPTVRSVKGMPYTRASTVRGRRVLYIGKAGSLRDRVRSYFTKDVALSRSLVIEKMIKEAEDIYFQRTDSVLEALILEAELIKKYKPKYNVREKDDKSFNYVVITDEDFPRVLLIRGKGLRTTNYRLHTTFGPFPQGGVLKAALAVVRKIFPFRDKCTPERHSNILENVGMSLNKRKSLPALTRRLRRDGRQSALTKPCFNRQIGLCPGVCTGEISKREYRKIIRNIQLLFEGKKQSLVKKLTREMKYAAEKRDFEDAAQLRNTIFALNHIQDIALLKDDLRIGDKIVDKPNKGPTFGELVNKGVFRIEGYDVAHMAGKEIVGVMVVVEKGVSEKNDYRKFILRAVKTADDPGALKEILERRLKHREWPFPDLIVVDGGKAQTNAAQRVLRKYHLRISVIGVVKDERHRPKKIVGNGGFISQYEKEILLANSEAHRFAVGFHRKRMRGRMK